MTNAVKRTVLGRPMLTSSLGETLLPKRLALPVFCSDPLSSVAYATEQILLVLVVGGTALLAMTGWVALGVIALLGLVVWSYRQTVHAYPNGGGAYAVSKENLGTAAALVAASALMVDYVLTVAVSITAGVANIASALPALADHLVPLSLGLIVVLAVMNLRGVKEAGTAFAIPTYGFIASVFVMLGVAAAKSISGDPVVAASASLPLEQTHDVVGVALVLVVLRAFASGCTALTGVEAVSNGVPFFQRPKARNAALTLVIMGGVAITMFAGVTLLAMTSGAKIAEDPAMLGLPPDALQPTIIAQLGMAVFGDTGLGFYLLQAFTAAILILAANTAFNGFPILASILGRDDFLPRQLGRRGDRLVYSNGIVMLTLVAGLLVYVFDASTTRLIQLYILGVFVSFTLSQAGMVIHWNRELKRPGAAIGGMRRSRLANLIGAAMTALVLVIVLVSKFTHGAWMVTIAIPLLVILMLAIRRHYARVDDALTTPPGGVVLPSRVHALVLVSRLHQPAIQALAYARATRPSTLVGLHVQTDAAETESLRIAWERREIPAPLVIVDSPYRDITRPVLDHVRSIHRKSPRDVVAVYVPEYVVTHWWQQMLHNQSALRLKARLLFLPGVMVTSVPTVVHDDAPADVDRTAVSPDGIVRS